jgi:hypothetical protein
MKQSNELIAERTKDLLEAERLVIKRIGKDAPYVSRKHIINMVSTEPAPRYYISTEEAMRIVSMINKGRPIKRSGIKKRMYQEIYDKYTSERNLTPCECKSATMERVLYTKASCFFITRGTIENILSKAK